MDIQQLFQERLPHRPYCTDDFDYGLRIRKKDVALRHRHIQPNRPQAATWLMFDLDYPGAALAWEKANLPVPTIIVKNPANAHANLFYGLETPVCSSVSGRIGPQRYFKAVRDTMRIKLDADPGYANLIAKNPFHPHWHTQWMPKLYDLGELCEYVTLPKKAPRLAPDLSHLKRNSKLFELLRLWAYKQVLVFEREGGGFDQWDAYVLDQAEAINASAFPHNPLPFPKVKSTAKSAAKWVWANFSNQAFSAIQSARGRKGGRPRTTTSSGKPWQALGISRSSWYEKRKAGLLPSSQDTDPGLDKNHIR